MGDENPIRTLGDYSKPSHKGYRYTIELPVGNNVVPLRSDTIRLVPNGCSFHGLRSKDPNQHLKDFLNLVDLLDLDGDNRERTRMRLFQFSLHDQASNWLKLLPARSITTWEDLTTRFIAQFFPPGRNAKLRNDILMFQQHHGESLSEAWTRFKDLLQKVPRQGIDLWLQVQFFYNHVNPVTRRTIDQSAGGKLRDLNAKESWALLEDLTLYDNESGTTQGISLNRSRQSLCLKMSRICSGPHDTQYCMEDPEQAFVEYASSRTNEAGGKWYTFKPEQNNLDDTYNPSWRSHLNLRWRQPQNSQNNFSNPPNRFQSNGSNPNRSFNDNPRSFNNQSNLEGLVSNFMASQDTRLSKFEADFKQQQSEMTNKIDTMLKAITDGIVGILPSDTVKNPKLSTTPVLSARSYPTEICNAQPTSIDKKKKATLEPSTLTHKVLSGGPVYDAILKKKITKKEDIRGNFEIPCSRGDLKHMNALVDQGSDNLEKEHTKSVYLRNEKDKKRGVDYVMSKILWFYKGSLELGPEYVTRMDDDGEVTLYLTRRSLEVLRKFHWMILGG
ncbi:MAK10-like protein [Tanacetum coccineum]